MIKTGIIGGAGYTAGELIRILLNHPEVELSFVMSNSHAGAMISEVHQDLIGETELKFTNSFNDDIDLLYLCLGHGNSKKALEGLSLQENTKIIDLSNDFRLIANNSFKGRNFVYGLPELNQEALKQANAVANPGCFATAIQLALLPLATKKLIKEDVHIHAVTGSTGAGVGLTPTSHFSWRNNNLSVYKAFNHQHLDEINESLVQEQGDMNSQLNFIPMRGCFTRGILATVYTKYSGSLEEAYTLYKAYYENAEFTVLSEAPIHLKQVVNSNKCLLHLEVHDNKLLITSAIDNLVKGASGQAVHNMNIMFGLPQKTGLNLKASYF